MRKKLERDEFHKDKTNLTLFFKTTGTRTNDSTCLRNRVPDWSEYFIKVKNKAHLIQVHYTLPPLVFAA